MFPTTLQMIIDTNGCVLQDLDLRRGRRRYRVLNDPNYQKFKGDTGTSDSSYGEQSNCSYNETIVNMNICKLKFIYNDRICTI